MQPQFMRYLKTEKLWLKQAQRPGVPPAGPAPQFPKWPLRHLLRIPRIQGVMYIDMHTCESIEVDPPLLPKCPLIFYPCCPGSCLSLVGACNAMWRNYTLPLLPWKHQGPQQGYCLSLLSKLPKQMPEQCQACHTGGHKGPFSHALTFLSWYSKAHTFSFAYSHCLLNNFSFWFRWEQIPYHSFHLYLILLFLTLIKTKSKKWSETGMFVKQSLWAYAYVCRESVGHV